MSTPISALFATDKDIFRKIEKVVTFGSLEDKSLGQELSEYVVTNNLRSGFDKILSALDRGMGDSSHEVGIWLSGFYGSGKSSFAKYLGLALDIEQQAGGMPIFEKLANRIDDEQVGQLLRTVVRKYNPQVFLLDLASQQIHTHIHAPVEDVIYAEVMKWAGYAAESKVAELEQLLDADGRLAEFKIAVEALKKGPWDTLKFTSPAAAKTIAGRLAAHFYPEIWPNSQEFQQVEVQSTENQRERLERMLNLIRRRSGRQHVVFVLDEVGQYIASDEGGLILKLQGTMQNLKDLGQGKAWLIATAQQTLTEDNPNAKYNSNQLFKLNDRFPIKLGIEASDIKEITTKRLLGKSAEGAARLRTLYAQVGEQLRICTRLEKTEKTIFQDEVREESFIDLYPFLPHHFALLTSLLSKLSKGTGGIGLRSVIRVVQDVLIDGGERQVANRPVGKLTTAEDLFLTLRADIQRAYPYLISATEKVEQIFGASSQELQVARSVVVLQIVDDFPLTTGNLAALLHPAVDATDQRATIRKKVDELIGTRGLTLKEIDGTLRFMTDAVLRLGDEKDAYPVTDSDVRKVLQDQLVELFPVAPSARLKNEKTVVTGLQLLWRGRPISVQGNAEKMQTLFSFELPDLYSDRVLEAQKQSTEAVHETAMFAVGRLDAKLDEDLQEIVRCEAMQKGRDHEDKEIADYRQSQRQEAIRLKENLRRRLEKALAQGELIVRGASKPIASYAGPSAQVPTAVATCLREAADRVYSNLGQAAKALGQEAAKLLLHIDDLKLLPESLNPFQLVKADGSININAPALRSISEHLAGEGAVEGRKLLDTFAEPPYGWAKDTTRYLVAVMFLGSLVKLRIGGESITVKGIQSIEKLSTSTQFAAIGIEPPSGNQPTIVQLTQAAHHLTILTGQTVTPLPQKISATVVKHFPEFQRQYGSLAFQLRTLNLRGTSRAEELQSSLVEILRGDASDASFRLGAADAPLVQDLKWAREVSDAFSRQNLADTVGRLRAILEQLPQLPNVELLNSLRSNAETQKNQVTEILADDRFCARMPELKEALSLLSTMVETTSATFQDQETALMRKQIDELSSNYGWERLDTDQQTELQAKLQSMLLTDVPAGLPGLHAIVAAAYGFNSALPEIKIEIQLLAEANEAAQPSQKKRRRVTMPSLPKSIERATDLDPLIQELTTLRASLADDEIVDLQW